MEILPQAPLFMRFCLTENDAVEGAFLCLFGSPKDRRNFCEM